MRMIRPKVNVVLTLNKWLTPYFNKKSDLMLMRCARAYSSSYSQVVLVCVHPFRRKTLFCRRK